MAVSAFLRNVTSQFEILKFKTPEYFDFHGLSNCPNNVANPLKPLIFQFRCSFLVDKNLNTKLRFRTFCSNVT